MNDSKINPLITYNKEDNKEKKEESLEDYQIIKEDYCSSPKCGIKSKIVTKSVEKIIFSPIEISTNPYFKYCVTPVKDEHFKFDFSQSETNHTRNQEEKKCKHNIKNNSNNQNLYIKIIKDELEEEKDENESENENKEGIIDKNNKIHILDKKENETCLKIDDNYNNINDKPLEEKSFKLKNKKINLHKTKTLTDNYNHHSINLKEKMKLTLNEGNEITKENKKLKNSHKNMNNLLRLRAEENKNNKISETEMNNNSNSHNNRTKGNSIFQTLKEKKENNKNIKKRMSPFKISKDKKEPFKVSSSLTTEDINRISSKKKKGQENELKKIKTSNDIHAHYNNMNNVNINYTNTNKAKREKNKIKSKNYLKEIDNSEENLKKLKKEINNKYNNMYDNNKENNNDGYLINKQKKKRTKHKKMKSMGEKISAIKKDFNKLVEDEDKNKDKDNGIYNNKEKENLKVKANDDSSKRRANNIHSYKININLTFKKKANLFEIPSSSKRRRRSIFDDINLNYNKKKNILLSIRKEKENLTGKKKSAFIIKADFDKDKNILKEKVKEKEKKDKDNDNDINLKKKYIRDKKEKKKSKKKEKSKIKDKGLDKELMNDNQEKQKDSNSKIINKDLREKNRSNKTNNKYFLQKNLRKENSHIINNKNDINFSNNIILKKESANKLSIYPTLNESMKTGFKNLLSLKRMESIDYSTKSINKINPNSSKKFIGCGRRNSTTILFHSNKSQNEKITAYTNKQTIDNINEYTKKCLEIIPEIFTLEEIPRCKNKIHLDFLKKNGKNLKKKIALFDLDETIVHCIGEINMNNVENFSRQSDAKIKVILPGGKQITIGINIRPHWEQALDLIKNKYHIIAYTASHESYADSVLNYLDPKKIYFEYRLYRSHCVLCVVNEMKFYVKDLGILEDCCDLKDVVLIDNSVLSFAYHLDNGIPISPFYDSKTDTELLDIANFLLKCADENDIRNKLREVYKLNEYLEIIKNYNSEESFTSSSSISIVQEDEEGEKTNKNCMNKNNNNNKFTFTLNINKSNGDKNIIHENEEDDNSNNDANSNNNRNNSVNLKSQGKKKSSQYNKRFSEIINFFDKYGENSRKSKSFTFKEKNEKKHDSKKINDSLNMNRNIDKSWCLIRKKNKCRSFRYFDINFKKEWDENQKELK